MDTTFAGVGNHLIPDPATAINDGPDDLTTIGSDGNLLYGKFPSNNGQRRADGDGNQADALEDEDNRSVGSGVIAGMDKLNMKQEQEQDLPAHACA